MTPRDNHLAIQELKQKTKERFERLETRVKELEEREQTHVAQTTQLIYAVDRLLTRLLELQNGPR